MRHLADGNGLLDVLLCLEVRVRPFKAVIPERELTGADILLFHPFMDVPGGALLSIPLHFRSSRNVGMRTGGISNHHYTFALFVLKEVKDTFLLHEAAHEVEISLPVLDAVVTSLICAGKRVVNTLQAGQ